MFEILNGVFDLQMQSIDITLANYSVAFVMFTSLAIAIICAR